MKTNARTPAVPRPIALSLLFAALGLAAAPGHASELSLRLERCSVLGDASARLACYDALAKAAPDGTVAIINAVADAPAATQPAPPAAARPLPAAVVAVTTIPPEASISRMVQWWELDQPSKRGVFNFRPHRDNYLVLANYSTSSNDGPFKDFTPAGIEAQHTELTYQISFKMKMIEQVLSTPIDLWFGYTQQSYWQAYNRAASSPFRETNYQPELMLTTPLAIKLPGLDIRYAALGAVHQSNGQTSSLSRSWNRVYAEVGAEHGDLALALRLWKRLDNTKSNNDNVDIVDFMGHGDLRATYRFDGHELSVTGRRNFQKRHGSLQFGWAFPMTANLKGYLQAFTGYGQSLIDYNYSQKSLGAGFLIDF
ncbi:phospholipase A [Rugamonas sp. DEMB1]|uniref:phospholipase A n=1 Tax=Rugamonas sp. DEMB1 TaxID=3039386 RepID=UPI002446DB07|nr:phospholipase A [Rugamonas sp. DEMB1]WGG53101.1 phospholipase A [Rugamonas sp. DEMB1]